MNPARPLRTGLLALLMLLACAPGLSQAKSTKRGLAYGQHTAEDLKALAPGVSWWYNWSPTPESGAASVYVAQKVAFMPMVWGGSPNADQLVAAIPSGADTLLGFNEPNFTAQANMTPSQAAAKWPILQDVARRKGLKIASPAVNYCGGCVSENGTTYSDPVVYMDAFLAACKNCQVDYIAIHWYACDLGALQWYVGLFKKYNKPIWLTEFACGDKPADQITLDVQKNYMTAAVNYLENEPAVARYAWFSGRNNSIPNVNLLGSNGQLTDLGKLYLSLPAGGTSSSPGRLQPVTATASSSEGTDVVATKAIDGNMSTRWSSAFSDPQWLTVDLGASKSISEIQINWEAAYGKAYQVQVSNDNATWTTAATVTAGDGGLDDLAFSATGRYVRIYGTQRATGYGYSIFEVNVLGK